VNISNVRLAQSYDELIWLKMQKWKYQDRSQEGDSVWMENAASNVWMDRFACKLLMYGTI